MRPALKVRTAAAMSSVRVPSFGLGMRPLGPKMRATLLNSGFKDFVATSLSNSIALLPSLAMRSMSASSPMMSAPASPECSK